MSYKLFKSFVSAPKLNKIQFYNFYMRALSHESFINFRLQVTGLVRYTIFFHKYFNLEIENYILVNIIKDIYKLENL